VDKNWSGQVAARFSLDGSIIPRRVKRLFDQRSEPRIECDSHSGVISFRGTEHVVPLVNCSSSGAMVLFDRIPNIGETLVFRTSDRPASKAQVRWVRDGKIGLTFLGRVE
jgi:hypothetical protein